MAAGMLALLVALPFLLLSSLLLAAGVGARSAHVHPLSQFKRPVGERVHLSAFGPTLSASPSVIHGKGGVVNVTWANYQYPSSTDWIGLFCPASVSAYNVAPLKFRWLPSTSSNAGPGSSGSMLFYVQNLRADCQFVLFSGGAQFPLIEATSNTVSVPDYNLPSSVRISLVNSDSSPSMRVSWSTKNASKPSIRLGTKSGEYTTTLAAETYTYTAQDMCTEPATTRGWYDPGSLHTVVLKDLVPGTQYFYKVGDMQSPDDATLWSPETDFFAPAPLDEVRVIAFGDMGNAPVDGTQQHSWDYDNHGEINSLNTTTRLIGEVNSATRPNAVVHFGDICYAVGYQAEWDQFHEQIRPVASRVPWMVGIGNHEMDVPTSFIPGTDSGGECGVTYSQRYLMPSPADTRRPDAPWYQFVVGPVQFIMMSSEHDFRPGSPQHTFLQRALSSVDRQRTPWLVFTGHRPMYIDSTYAGSPYSDQEFAKTMRANLEGLLVAAKVDLAMWGHHHSFQRTCAVVGEVCTAGAPVHVVVGTAGYELRGSFIDPKPAWVEKAVATWWGYARLHATRTQLTMEFVINEDGSVQDTLTLTKSGSA